MCKAGMSKTITLELDGMNYRRLQEELSKKWEAEKRLKRQIERMEPLVVSGVEYETSSVDFRYSGEIDLEYRSVVKNVEGWTGSSHLLRGRFETDSRSEDLFSERAENWDEVTATFTWPVEGEQRGSVLFEIARDSEVKSLRNFVLVGSNVNNMCDFFPKRDTVSFTVECELSVDRAIAALNLLGNGGFGWLVPMEDKLRAVKRYMRRGRFGIDDAERVIAEAVERFAASINAGGWNPKPVEEHSFDLIDSTLIALYEGTSDPSGAVLELFAQSGLGLADVAVREEVR